MIDEAVESVEPIEPIDDVSQDADSLDLANVLTATPVAPGKPRSRRDRKADPRVVPRRRPSAAIRELEKRACNHSTSLRRSASRCSLCAEAALAAVGESLLITRPQRTFFACEDPYDGTPRSIVPKSSTRRGGVHGE